MKTILCYGDSNTFGFNPKNASRYDENTRWPSVLQKNLGTEYNVINEGLCNRTGFVDNPDGSLYSAQKHFPEILSKISSITLLILAVGTNDLMFKYNINLDTIDKGLINLIKLAKNKTNNIIIFPPVVLNKNILNGFFGSMFNEDSILKSKDVWKIFKKVTNENCCNYFDINEFTVPSDIDGLHYNENSHKLIANKLTEFIKENEF